MKRRKRKKDAESVRCLKWTEGETTHTRKRTQSTRSRHIPFFPANELVDEGRKVSLLIDFLKFYLLRPLDQLANYKIGSLHDEMVFLSSHHVNERSRGIWFTYSIITNYITTEIIWKERRTKSSSQSIIVPCIYRWRKMMMTIQTIHVERLCFIVQDR